MTWVWLSILAALIWGLEYALGEKVLDKVSALLLFFWSCIIQAVFAIILATYTKTPLSPLPLLERHTRWPALCYGFLAFVAGLSITSSIKTSSNATISSLIEISYPFFVAMFTWLLFRENRMSWGVAVGGVLIMAGIAV